MAGDPEERDALGVGMTDGTAWMICAAGESFRWILVNLPQVTGIRVGHHWRAGLRIDALYRIAAGAGHPVPCFRQGSVTPGKGSRYRSPSLASPESALLSYQRVDRSFFSSRLVLFLEAYRWAEVYVPCQVI